MDRSISQVLHDRYRLRSLLRRQTGRRTFLADDLETGLPVVVKLLLFGPDFTWDDLKLFEREAEVLKSINHPAIPKYLDGFEADTELGKGFALVQTYIEAKSLLAWAQSGRSFSQEELKAIVKELLQILNYLHSRQPAVVHRDLKPSNILLTDGTAQSPRQVYLIDFGSAQTSLTGGTITIVGTYGYMPPEQFGRRALPASDLYALGATLIYLATGQEPSELLQKDMRILFDKRVNLDRDFVDWLKRMTEPSLDLRLDSAQKALEALESAPRRKLTLPITAKPISSEIPIANAMSTIRLAMTYNLFSASLYLLSLVLWNHGGWFLALLAIYYLGNGLFLIASILYANSKEIQHQLAKSS